MSFCYYCVFIKRHLDFRYSHLDNKIVIKLLRKNSSEIEPVPIEIFEKEMGVRWRSHIRFRESGYERKARRRSAYAMRKKELNLREKWLGCRFQHEIIEGTLPEVSIRYIDSVLNYGVFAEESIPKGKFIGEYTGVIRKRKWGSDRKNDYCFEYTIGDWIYNPFIIDAKDEGNMTRFMNHSEDPNIESLSVFADGLMHIIFITEKKIEKGEQLCYHYGDTFWKKRRRAVKIEINGS